jgi:hypothetical protein
MSGVNLSSIQNSDWVPLWKANPTRVRVVPPDSMVSTKTLEPLVNATSSALTEPEVARATVT